MVGVKRNNRTLSISWYQPSISSRKKCRQKIFQLWQKMSSNNQTVSQSPNSAFSKKFLPNLQLDQVGITLLGPCLPQQMSDVAALPSPPLVVYPAFDDVRTTTTSSFYYPTTTVGTTTQVCHNNFFNRIILNMASIKAFI